MNSKPRSLLLLVSLVVTVSFLSLSVVFGFGQYQSLKRQAYDDSMVNLRALMMMTQARAERAFAENDMTGLERDVMGLNLLDDVRLSAVIDELGKVVSSSNFLILGQPAASQLQQFDDERFEQVRASYRPTLIVDPDRINIHAYYPLNISHSANSLRPDRVGVLYVHWSMERQYQIILYNLQREMLLMSGLMASVVALLLFVLHRLLLKPVQQLMEKAVDAAEGHKIASFHVDGVAEIRNLSQAIHRMHLQLAANMHEVRRSEERWLFALEGAGEGVMDYDYRNGTCYFSPLLRRLLHLTADEPASFERWQEAIHPEDWIYVERRLQRHLRGLADTCSAEFRISGLGEQYRYMLMRGKVVEWRPDGEPARLVITQSDVTARRQMENALRSSEKKYRMLFDLAQEGIWVIDADGITSLVNPAMCNMLGYTKEEMLGKPLLDFMGSEEARQDALESIKRRRGGLTEQFDFELVSRAGRRLYVTVQTAPILDDNGVFVGAIAGIMDMTARRQAEERIRQQALYDDLTFLPNRRMLNEKLLREHARAVRHAHVGALLFIDLDHFKNINDSLGHPVGDALLMAASTRLKKVLREEDMLARLGGDEFVVLLPELSNVPTEAASQAWQVAKKIQTALSTPFDIVGHKLAIGCSIGIAVYPQDQDTIHDILKQADSAMYRAKEEGRNAICIFSKEMHAQFEQNLHLQIRMPKALEQNQFELYYQPQFNHRRELIGAEVLLRWREPERGFVRPDHFIRAAEESGFIITLGQWVLQQACRQLKAWQPHLPASFQQLAINISARQFALDDFPQQVQRMVEDAAIDPGLIELEITESFLLNRLEQAVKKFTRLHDMGFKIALDDFGTGYSSLSYLRSLPLHKLKIDQAFVRDIQQDKNDRAIVETIIAMARHMELDVIAEGVEEEAQFLFLQQKGCLQYQGYYFAKPVPAAEFFSQWLQGGATVET